MVQGPGQRPDHDRRPGTREQRYWTQRQSRAFAQVSQSDNTPQNMAAAVFSEPLYFHRHIHL